MNFPCTTCSRHFRTDKELKNHEKYSHMNTKVFRCNPCNRCFKTDNALKQHEKTSPMHTKAFHCDPCNRSFTCEERLAKHRRQCQVVQKPAQDTVKISPNQASKMAELSNALARVSILDMPALAVQRHARMPVLENLVTAKPPMVVTKFPRPPKKDPPKRPRETREYFTFPELHARIEEAVLPEITSTWFKQSEDGDNSNKKHDTNVMGKFICNNKSCEKQGWGSWVVFTEIKGYPGNGYGAIVYNQRCKACDCLGTFTLDEQSYIDRVSFWVKVWGGVHIDWEDYGSDNEVETKPHEWKYCEGCRRRKCKKGKRLGLF